MDLAHLCGSSGSPAAGLLGPSAVSQPAQLQAAGAGRHSARAGASRQQVARQAAQAAGGPLSSISGNSTVLAATQQLAITQQGLVLQGLVTSMQRVSAVALGGVMLVLALRRPPRKAQAQMEPASVAAGHVQLASDHLDKLA